MVSGLALFGWNQQAGSILDIKYPESFEISDSLRNKIYMTHSYSQDFGKEELIEINYENQVIYSYCNKTTAHLVGYEIIILMLHEKENINSYNLKKQLLDFSHKVFQAPKAERNRIFIENIDVFFKKPTPKKILLLGRAGTGKTSILKIIFEGQDPKDLIYNPLAPTRGIVPSVYSWLDLNLGLFDSSGQELPYLLAEDNEQKIAFGNAAAIIYLFDFQNWANNSQDIINEIQTISNIIKNQSYNAKLFLFLHKIDLMKQDKKDQILNEIKQIFLSKFHLTIYFTSIYPNMIYSLYNAFYDILSSYSEETTILRNILENRIKEISKIMCFITDQNNSIIVQTMSSDFNTLLINYSHKLIIQLNQSFEDMSENQIDHLIISSANNLNIILNNLNLQKFNIKNLIAISETLTANKLIWLMGQIRSELNGYLYFKQKN